jgi:hypothetical protein
MKKLFEVVIEAYAVVLVEAETEEQALEAASDDVSTGDFEIHESTVKEQEESQRSILVRHYGEPIKA